MTDIAVRIRRWQRIGMLVAALAFLFPFCILNGWHFGAVVGGALGGIIFAVATSPIADFAARAFANGGQHG